MTNPYYNHTDGVPVYLARGTSSAIEAEYDLIGAGFDGVNTAIVAAAATSTAALALKGNITTQTWLGTHTFPSTTYGVTATPGSTGLGFATIDFVNGVALAGTLPAQSGKADNFMTTDGGAPGTASWSPNLKATVIRFKDGTDATKLMAFDLSGIATATTRTVAVPNKNGTMAMLSDIPTTYALTLLATLTPTAAANVDFLSAFSSTYDNYLISFDSIRPSADDVLAIRFAVAGSADTGSNYYSSNASNGTSVYTGSATSITSSNLVSTAGKGSNGQVLVLNANDTTNLKNVAIQSSAQANATPGYNNTWIGGVYPPASAISGIRFFWTGGSNFAASGKIRVYGYQNS